MDAQKQDLTNNPPSGKNVGDLADDGSREHIMQEAYQDACGELYHLMVCSTKPGFFATGQGISFDTRDGVIGAIRIQGGEQTKHVS